MELPMHRILVANEVVERLDVDDDVARDERRPREPVWREPLTEQARAEVKWRERQS
jgi:hypothetical protein